MGLKACLFSPVPRLSISPHFQQLAELAAVNGHIEMDNPTAADQSKTPHFGLLHIGIKNRRPGNRGLLPAARFIEKMRESMPGFPDRAEWQHAGRPIVPN